jgi:HTH-type transcriptional regulator/antitoxin HigA
MEAAVEWLATIVALLAEIGDDEGHPLAEVLNDLADQVKTYEDENVQIPVAAPADVLRFLIDQHGLLQQELATARRKAGSPTSWSAGRRAISKPVAKRLAARFHVRADLFL